jgi:hypothetical protein
MAGVAEQVEAVAYLRTSSASSAWPIYDPDYRWRRLQAACKAASNQRGRQPCLLGLRSNRGTKGLADATLTDIAETAVNLAAEAA